MLCCWCGQKGPQRPRRQHGGHHPSGTRRGHPAIVAIGDKQTELDRAKSAIKLAVRARYIDLPIVSIEVSDEDAQRYIDGATIEELLA